MRGSLSGYKTYLVAALAVAGALIGWLTGDLTNWQAVQAVGGAVFAATLRDGIKAAAETAYFGPSYRAKPK